MAVVINISSADVYLEKNCICPPAVVQDAEAGDKLQAVETQLCGLQGVQHLVEVNLVQFQLSEEIKFTKDFSLISRKSMTGRKNLILKT